MPQKTPKIRNTSPNKTVQDRLVSWPVATSRVRQVIQARRSWTWALLGGGLALLALLGIFYGPTLYAHFGHRFSSVSKNQATPADTGVLKSPNRISIPSLGIEAPIIYVDQTSEAAFQEALNSGVVHYPGTALPGQPGNTYIFGHSSDLPFSPGAYKTIFAALPNIEAGAEIYITDQRGNEFVYGAQETKVVDPDELSVLAQDKTKHQLTIQTSYPVGTAQKRFLVISAFKDQRSTVRGQ